MMYLKPYLSVLFLLAVFALAACGQTGDLYLPDDEPEENIKTDQKTNFLQPFSKSSINS